MIPKDEYYLPEIAFTPEELGALFVAAQSGGGDTAAEQAPASSLRRRRRRAGRPGGRSARLGLGRAQHARGRGGRRGAAAAAGPVRLPHVPRRGGGREMSTPTRWCSEAVTGTWWASTGTATTSERSDSLGSRPTWTTWARGAPPPRGLPGRRPRGVRALGGDARGHLASPSRRRLRGAPGTPSAGADETGPGDGRLARVAVPMADEAVLADLILQFGPDAVVLEPRFAP